MEPFRASYKTNALSSGRRFVRIHAFHWAVEWALCGSVPTPSRRARSWRHLQSPVRGTGSTDFLLTLDSAVGNPHGGSGKLHFRRARSGVDRWAGEDLPTARRSTKDSLTLRRASPAAIPNYGRALKPTSHVGRGTWTIQPLGGGAMRIRQRIGQPGFHGTCMSSQCFGTSGICTMIASFRLVTYYQALPRLHRTTSKRAP